ncbi:hypothetical protein K1728_05415 [Weissella confusa]|uniref:hypothetical protein n=1 Tax=Weissella confusa TaxID=1583 RepID=UPI001C6F776C|nr:hypothetical protein [Weissella confusa]QYU58837.1 hypothetical protein K1728_05415 [Weissella confusa]
MNSRDTENYRPIFKYKSVMRGQIPLGKRPEDRIPYAIAVANLVAAIIGLIPGYLMFLFFWQLHGLQMFAIAAFSAVPYGFYKVYDNLKPDGLSVPSYLSGSLKNWVKFRLKKTTLYQDESVLLVDEPVMISSPLFKDNAAER